mmetsp:Transcript_35836/g.83384  ORF Transcript_35836/g.83384 Transcript_35836/m.83384 type:complete len:247 (+) Transcript_35836:346-1086(+)
MTIWPRTQALAVLLVLAVFTDIACPVAPPKLSVAAQLTIHPLALVDVTASPSVGTFPMHVACHKPPVKPRAVSTLKTTLAMPATLHVLPLVAEAIGPLLRGQASEHAALPATSAASAICAGVHALAMWHVVLPVTLVAVTFRTAEDPPACSLVLDPLTFVARAPGPHLHAVPVALQIQPLTSVGHTALEDVGVLAAWQRRRGQAQALYKYCVGLVHVARAGAAGHESAVACASGVCSHGAGLPDLA